MRKRRSRTMSFSDEEWATITAASSIAGLNRSVHIAQLAKADLSKRPPAIADEALEKARTDIILADA